MKLYSTVTALVFILTFSAVAQSQSANVLAPVFQLGDQATTIPAPTGFAEAASQFETIRNQFTTTEAPGNEMLAVFLPQADCEKLRGGTFGPFNFYTKVSVRAAVRGESYSSARFADLIAYFRKNEVTLLDMNSPAMKATLRRLNQGLSDLNKKETNVDLPQLTRLGEFDTRPNVYSVMLLMNMTATSAGSVTTTPLLGTLTYLRVKDRMIYVYSYRRYSAAEDINVLRDFTKQWVTQILAAN